MTEKSHNTIELRVSGSTDDPETFVTKQEQREGGMAAWMTVVGAVLVYYTSVGFVSSFGFFNNYYSQELLKDTPTSTIAFIGTLQIALVNSLAAVAGSFCDCYGTRVCPRCLSEM